MRIAAVGDVHCTAESEKEVRELIHEAASHGDVLALAGDLTNMGRVEEMEVLLRILQPVSIPIVAVVGNHDHESDQVETLVGMMTESGLHVLDGDIWEVDGVGFIGTKGFCGGFGHLAVQPFGERALKMFIRTSIDEAFRLESSLLKLQAEKRVALLHFAPIKETLRGESPELYAFLGSSLLADALDRHGVNMIFHGHAHNGSPSGFTKRGIPVYNVSMQVQRRFNGRGYGLFEL